MAQQFSSGSVHVYCRGPGQTNAFYLGTCEQMPQDSRNPEYELLMNDISGSKKPLDLAWEGEDATISCILTRFNHVGWNLLETKPRPTVNANGAWGVQDVGSLISLEGLAWELWLVYAFGAALANKAAYVANAMPPGRYYPQCVVWAPMADETGTRPMKRQVVFYAWPKLVGTPAVAPTLSSAASDVPTINPTSFILYSTFPAFFTGLPAIT